MNPTPKALVNRRFFLRSMGAAALAAGAGPLFARERRRDSLPLQLYKSLSEEQRGKICLPKDDDRRDFISNWWYVHKDHRLNNAFTKDQTDLIQQIFDSLHNEEFRKAVNTQVKIDQYGKEKNAPSVGFFGTPEDEDFEFIYTGHHVTRRCNAHTDEGRGFGGHPIFYGHFLEQFRETKDHPGNPYWYQGKILNAFIKTLDAEEQKASQIEGSPRSEKPEAVIRMKEDGWPGLRLGDLSDDKKKAFVDAVTRMLVMFREDDVKATVAALGKKEFLDELHLSTYGGRFDIGSDQVWDTWQIEGPRFVWYMRGMPHIHCYFHLKA